MNRRLRQILNAVVYLIATGAFVALLSASFMAQQESNDPRDPANQETFNKRDMRERESALRTKAKTVRPLEQNPKLALGQIKEDYERIQVLSNEMRRIAAAKDAFDYKRVSAISAEMRKRAARLKDNLAFPEPEDDPKRQKNLPQVAPDDGQVKTSLAMLDSLIISFVNNPFFQSSTQKVDVQLTAKVSQELNSIIELCGDIKKSVKKLNKVGGKSASQ